GVGFRTWLQLSRDIVGTSTEVGGRPCRRGNSSSLRWWLKDAAKARSPATTTSPDNGSSNCAGGMRPRARRRSDRAHDAPHQCPSGAPRRRRPHPSAPQNLTKQGFDAGAETIAAHLAADPPPTCLRYPPS